MADNFLERHREEYEQRKAAWLKKKRHLPKKAAKNVAQTINRPEDEALQKYRYKIPCYLVSRLLTACRSHAKHEYYYNKV